MIVFIEKKIVYLIIYEYRKNHGLRIFLKDFILVQIIQAPTPLQEVKADFLPVNVFVDN